MHRGYIKLYRKIEDNPMWLEEPFTNAQAWIDLLIMANHKQSQLSIRGNIIKINKGQVCRAQDTLALRWKWSRGKVKRFLNRLENEGQIVQQNIQVISLIYIKNYDEYNQNDTTDNTTDGRQTDDRRTTDSTHTRMNKNDKNDKELNTPAAYAADLPEEWKPIFISWLKYKQERGQKYKSKETSMVAYKNLVNLSGNELNIAERIVEQSIANNWQGLFALKNNGNNGGTNVKSKFQQSVEAGERFLKNYGVEEPNENSGAQMHFDS